MSVVSTGSGCVYIHGLLKIVEMLRVLLRSGNSVNARYKQRFISTACILSKDALSLTVASESPLPTTIDSAKNESPLFNPYGVMDLCLQKFDPDLLYFPEVMTDDEWIELVDRGKALEEALNRIDYNNILQTGKISSEIIKKLGELDLFRLRVPSEYGGLNYKDTACKYIQEILGAQPSIARFIAENDEMGIRILTNYGSEQQKSKYLPALAAGESFLAMAFLEDNSAILDPNSFFGLEAVQVGNNFILKGKKCWVYNAPVADFFLVFATHAAADSEGVFLLNTLFLVPKNSEGLIVYKPMYKSWFKGLEVCEVALHDVTVSIDNIVGGIGNGFEILKDMIKQNKTASVAECSSAMKKLVFDITHKCDNSKFLNIPRSSTSYCELLIGELACMTFATESLVYYLAARNDYYHQPDLTVEGYLAKIFAYETLPEALQMYFNITGRHGYTRDLFAEELVQNAHFYSVLDDSLYDMKLCMMNQVLIHVAKNKSSSIKKAFLPMDHPEDYFKKYFKALRHEEGFYKSNLKLHEYVHNLVTPSARDLEYCICKLEHCVEMHLNENGRNSLKEDDKLMLLCDLLVNIYALIACIARTSRSCALRHPDHASSVNLTDMFSKRILRKAETIYRLLSTNQEEWFYYREIGKKSLKMKSYFAEHPLMRNF